MELKFISTEETNGIDCYGDSYHKTVKTYTIGDYRVNEINRVYEDCDSYSITVICSYNNKYTPEIYVLYEEDNLTKIKGFKIATTSYGSLSLNEYKEFLKAQEEAVEVVEILKDKYCGE